MDIPTPAGLRAHPGIAAPSDPSALAKGHPHPLLVRAVSLVALVAASSLGVLAGQAWMPLGLAVAAFVGATVAGPVEGLVAVLVVAVGAPVVRSVVHDIVHSWSYGPAVVFGLLAGFFLRRRLVRSR